MATTTCAPRRAMLRSACSRMDGFVTSNSRYCTPVSALNFSAPLNAASLKDLSNLPPMSKTTAGMKSSAWAMPPTAMPAAASAATMSRFMEVPPWVRI